MLRELHVFTTQDEAEHEKRAAGRVRQTDLYRYTSAVMQDQLLGLRAWKVEDHVDYDRLRCVGWGSKRISELQWRIKSCKQAEPEPAHFKDEWLFDPANMKPLLGHRADCVIKDDVTTSDKQFAWKQWFEQPVIDPKRAYSMAPFLGSSGSKSYTEPMKKRVDERFRVYNQLWEQLFKSGDAASRLRRDIENKLLWGTSDIESGISLVTEFNKRYRMRGEDMLDARCPFCGEVIVHKTTDENLSKKGRWKSRTTLTFACGTTKTTGDWKVKAPRVVIDKKGCTNIK